MGLLGLTEHALHVHFGLFRIRVSSKIVGYCLSQGFTSDIF